MDDCGGHYRYMKRRGLFSSFCTAVSLIHYGCKEQTIKNVYV